MKLHILAQLEGEGPAVGRGRPGFRGVGRNAHVLPIADILQQRRIVRTYGVQNSKRGAAMAIVVGGLCDHRKTEHPTALGRFRRQDAQGLPR